MEPFYRPLLNHKGIALGLARNGPVADYLKPIDTAYLRG
jgi:hypothetical protein